MNQQDASNSSTHAILTLAQVCKNYILDGQVINVLSGVDLNLFPGESCSVVGPSGCGKTTLLGIAAGLERATSGQVRLAGCDLVSSSEQELARLRKDTIGFVFQSFQLIPTLSALENVMLPAQLKGDLDCLDRAKELLSRVGLEKRQKHYPLQLSGGEQQRVALARAYINNPKILFADEPTGNLDEQTAQVVEDLLFELNREHGTALFIATHNQALAKRTSRCLRLSRGVVLDQ